mmetsp:Transcript_27803/g.35981  ORF Transcript_27803/g.35981 Transcript_27803/m.35981 type:complete len:196 (-) Transcript_27803:107-694(-)
MNMNESDQEDDLHHPLPNPLKAILQQFLSHKVFVASDLDTHIQKASKRFGAGTNLGTIDQCIGQINKSISLMHLEIRSVQIDGETYYGMVNKVADAVAIQNGTALQDWQLEILRKFIAAIAAKETDHELDREELNDLSDTSKTNRENETLLDALVEQHWLKQVDHATVAIGPRTYLELAGYLEDQGIQPPQIMYH